MNGEVHLITCHFFFMNTLTSAASAASLAARLLAETTQDPIGTTDGREVFP